ncbi:MAG: hypothetical protein ACYS30_07040 [Planctomycetota bacterium]
MKKKNDKDIVSKVVEALSETSVPPGPPESCVDTTLAKLAEVSEEAETAVVRKHIKFVERIKATEGFAKVAVAVMLLIVVGYVIGQLLAPRPPDVEKLQAAIRQDVLKEMKHYWQLGMANSYVQLKDELNEQYRRDLNEFAVRTIAASSAVTNQLLEELIESINAAKTEDLRRIARVLHYMESNRLQDTTQLTNGLETLAVHTGDELQRTRQDMVKLLVYRQPDSLVPKVTENSNNSNERKE